MNKIPIIAVESNSQFPLSSEEINLVAELGFMAATAGYVVPAIRIFQGLQVLRPVHAFPFVGLAVSRLYVGAFIDAVRVLRENAAGVLHGMDEIELYLGLALYLADQPAESTRVLISLLQRGELDVDQQSLAEAVLAQIEGKGQGFDWPSPARVIEIQDFSSNIH